MTWSELPVWVVPDGSGTNQMTGGSPAPHCVAGLQLFGLTPPPARPLEDDCCAAREPVWMTASNAKAATRTVAPAMDGQQRIARDMGHARDARDDDQRNASPYVTIRAPWPAW